MRILITNKTQVVGLVVVAFILAAVVTVVIVSGGGGGGTKAKPSATSHISGGLSRTDIEDLGQARGLSQIFWLGPPPAPEKIVTDTHRQDKEIQLAYVNHVAQNSIRKGKVAFTILVITQALSAKAATSEADELQKMAGQAIQRKGFTIYLPPKKYLAQHRFFMISSDHEWGGIVDYGRRSTLSTAEAIAKEVQVLRVPRNG